MASMACDTRLVHHDGVQESAQLLMCAELVSEGRWDVVAGQAHRRKVFLCYVLISYGRVMHRIFA
ncbi:hypothetical protein EJB05_51551 [Eragrostis curvula]|uniref:Uncharacterized protein n=1 Tax=Eragrostis curvula TaxID=38414 RepID=A0A5J9SV71_9POAL|nr:hypothetical protein EJB05_51551 [Eragrostis curvula]